MKRSQRLQTIIDLHQRQENDALQALGRSRQQLAAQQSQLDNLQQYRLEYQQKLGVRQQQGMNVSQLLEFRAFADKLDKAIEGQQQTVLKQERDVRSAQAKWEECHQRTKSLKKLAELAVAEEAKIEHRQEQKEQDARAARSKKNGMGAA